jgi:predicted nucleotidyltransferase
MISRQDREAITELAVRYDVRRILLFGSSADPVARDPQDIDLAVEGIRPDQYFKFYGDLLVSLSKPVDLVDLSQKGLFNEFVIRDGVQVYAKP